MPRQVVAVHVNNQVAVGRAAAVNPSRPPSSAGSSDVVLVKVLVHHHVLVEVRVAAEYVYAVALQSLFQLLCVAYVAVAALDVPACGVHVKQHERAFGHVAQVFFEPGYLLVGYVLLIFLAAGVVDALHRNDVRFADVERVVGRPEMPVILHFAVHGGAEAHVVKVLPALVEVVVAYALEHRHACVFYRLDVVFVQGHVVKYKVAERDSHHFAAQPQRVNRAADVSHGLAAPAFHVTLRAYLRVGDGYVVEVLVHFGALFEHEVAAVRTHCLAYRDVEAGRYAVAFRQAVGRRGGYAYVFAHYGVGAQRPASGSVGLREVHTVVHHDAFNATSGGVFHRA